MKYWRTGWRQVPSDEDDRRVFGDVRIQNSSSESWSVTFWAGSKWKWLQLRQKNRPCYLFLSKPVRKISTQGTKIQSTVCADLCCSPHGNEEEAGRSSKYKVGWATRPLVYHLRFMCRTVESRIWLCTNTSHLYPNTVCSLEYHSPN